MPPLLRWQPSSTPSPESSNLVGTLAAMKARAVPVCRTLWLAGTAIEESRQRSTSLAHPNSRAPHTRRRTRQTQHERPTYRGGPPAGYPASNPFPGSARSRSSFAPRPSSSRVVPLFAQLPDRADGLSLSDPYRVIGVRLEPVTALGSAYASPPKTKSPLPCPTRVREAVRLVFDYRCPETKC
ncbi:MAG: hypothetical protein QOE83_343 [Actinomycetota bacterium]|nr:hypothetical protein [Actinomycetota bacterium]